jgi:hypothetical protein
VLCRHPIPPPGSRVLTNLAEGIYGTGLIKRRRMLTGLSIMNRIQRARGKNIIWEVLFSLT